MGGTEGWRFEFKLSPLPPAPLNAPSHAQPSSLSHSSAVANDGGAPPLTSSPPWPSRVLLSCYGMPSPPQVGERWSLHVKWRRPRGLMNPHGGDSALWLLSQNIPAVGTCSGKAQTRERDERDGSPWSVDAWRQRFRDAIHREVGDARGAGVLAALSLGDQGAVSVSMNLSQPRPKSPSFSSGNRQIRAIFGGLAGQSICPRTPRSVPKNGEMGCQRRSLFAPPGRVLGGVSGAAARQGASLGALMPPGLARFRPGAHKGQHTFQALTDWFPKALIVAADALPHGLRGTDLSLRCWVAELRKLGIRDKSVR